MWFFKNLIHPHRFMARVTKLIWLTHLMMNVVLIELLTPKAVWLFLLPRAILPLLSALNQSCCDKSLQTFLESFIQVFVQTNFAFVQMPFNVNGVSVVNKSDFAFTAQFICWLFTSCALLFRLSFRSTISDIVTVFVSDFSDSARSMTDLDIWLAALLLLSSFVPTCSTMWFRLNSRIVGLTWSYIELTLPPLNDLTLISFLFRNIFVKR